MCAGGKRDAACQQSDEVRFLLTELTLPTKFAAD